MSVGRKAADVNGASRPGPAEPEHNVRDFRGKHWFWIDNEIVDRYGHEIGPKGIAAYAVLCRMADKDSQSCWPSYSTIAARMGVSRVTAIDAIAKLVDVGLVAVEPRYDHEGRNVSNLFTLLPLPERGVKD